MRNTVLCAVILTLSCSLTFGQEYKVIWSFGGRFGNDGAEPMGTLVSDEQGNLYGTTRVGGNQDEGSIFELSPNPDGTWLETILYSLCYDGVYCFEGADPEAGLIRDTAGHLFGTARAGGSGEGVAFELLPPSSPGSKWAYRTLHYFCPFRCSDGSLPVAALVTDASGNLFGTASSGGDGNGGTVFELSRSQGEWTFQTLYTFCSVGVFPHCPDGWGPQAGLSFDKDGNLWGTTEAGGSWKDGGGTVFKLAPSQSDWTENVVYAFPGYQSRNGRYPVAPVKLDAVGNVYGTFTDGNGGVEYGGVFRLTPRNGGKKQTVSFNLADGAVPWSEVLIDPNERVLYGTTSGLGFWPSYSGNVFKIDASGNVNVLKNFCEETNCTDGSEPFAGLIRTSSGKIYGTARYGGSNNFGVVFEITP